MGENDNGNKKQSEDEKKQVILDERDYMELDQAIVLAQHTVYKRYVQELDKYTLVRPTNSLLVETAEDCVRFLQLEELSCKKGEDMLQKLSTVYHASMALGCNLVVLVDVEGVNAPAKIYIGVRNTGADSEEKKKLGNSYRTLKSGLKSNFPGTRFRDMGSQKEMPKLIDEVFGDSAKHISSVSGVASIRDKSKTENKSFIQGIERFIEAMRGNAYTAIFIAQPIGTHEMAAMRSGYEEIYSIISAFAKSVWSYNENESMSVMKSLSKGITKTITNGVSHTQSSSYNVGVNLGLNKSRGDTHTDSAPTKVARAGQFLGALDKVADVVSLIDPKLGIVAKALSVVGDTMKGASHSDSICNTFGIAGGLSGGVTKGTSDTKQHSESVAQMESEMEGSQNSHGLGRTLQIEKANKSITELLTRIESQLKRIQECEDYGSYSCGAYFLSGKQDSCLLAANTYRALMIGEGSSVENSAINYWNGSEPEKEEIVDAMKEYLRRFVHPLFGMKAYEEDEQMIFYTPGTTVSGLELPLHLGLPMKSVYGLPVLEHAEFGRNVMRRGNSTPISDDKENVKIGNIYHMGQSENAGVSLNCRELTAHTFITGSTGSGKSNTVYKMLHELDQQGVRYLVIEPAKGEYKAALGNSNNVTVYGTNPKLGYIELLRINPFSFPESVHVLEHMDRLVEIFNVCWPMYAAMPAILKDAVERAYISAGWDLLASENKCGEKIYPTFVDVLQQIRVVLLESEYSADNKGDYTGALVTRLRSLTNGINGLIFSANGISDEKLFDENAIVDLSRIGSTETKALIMGLLVLKLQEHRMDVSKPNSNLRHVTVLEEAHNLLKRTSQEQSSESSNLLGKSVEMLANSIAEMRTYGEGFIIADQSPGLLDMSAIRNTNTKIILRLPDYSDRELVGKAAGLNEDQIVELAKLDRGVAAIMQSEWLEPVLCQIDYYAIKEEIIGERSSYVIPKECVNEENISQSLLECIMENEIYRKGDRVDINKLKEAVLKSSLDTSVKCHFIEYISSEGNTAVEALRSLIYVFLGAKEAIAATKTCRTIEDWVHSVVQKLRPELTGYSDTQIDLVMSLIIYEQSIRDTTYNDIFCRFEKIYRLKGGVY